MALNIPQKTGFYTLRKLAYGMCQALARFSPVIRQFFPDRPVLLALLTTAETVCHELVAEIDATRKAIYPP